MNWPIGDGPDFQGVYDLQTSQMLLFERTSRGLVPTAHGEAVLDYAHRWLAELDATFAGYAQTGSGQVRRYMIVFGLLSSVFDLLQSTALNHRAVVVGAVLGEACGTLLREFFRARRSRPVSAETALNAD